MIETALALNIIFFAAVIAVLFSQRFINFYSGLSIYLAFHYLVFVQRPLIVYLFGFNAAFEYMRYMPTEEVFVRTIFVANVGLVAFTFGYLSVLRFKPMQTKFALPSLGRIEKQSIKIALLILSPLILYSFFLAFTMRQSVGTEVLEELGRFNMTIDPATGRTLFTDTTAYLIGGRNFAFAFGTYLIFLTGGRWWSYLVTAATAMVALQLGERWPMVIAVVATTLLTMHLRRRSTISFAQGATLLAALFAFMAVGQNRETLIKFLLTGDLDIHFDLEQSSFGNHFDFANFDFLTYIVGNIPDTSRTYTYFTQYLGALTQPIPRILWPDKPVGSPIVLINLESFGHFTSLTTSLVGDGWMSLGYPGVGLTTGLVGALYGWLFKKFCSSTSLYFYLGYFWLEALLIQWARDGGYTILVFIGFSAGPFALAYTIEWYLRRQQVAVGRTIAHSPRSRPPHP